MLKRACAALHDMSEPDKLTWGASVSGHAANPLLRLLNLGHRARAALHAKELAFLLVNDTREIVPYRQAVLWWHEGGVHTLSGVMQIESNTPYVQWLHGLCLALATSDAANDPRLPRKLTAAEVPKEIAADWAEWLPEHVLWVPLAGDRQRPASASGGLLLAAQDEFPDELLPLLGEWVDVWQHAWQGIHRPLPWSRRELVTTFHSWLAGRRQVRWWQWRPYQIGLVLLLVLLFPIRLTTLAAGELVPRSPGVIRAPLDGVIGQFHVAPNQSVKAGEALFSFDEAPIASRLAVARQALATAEMEYRQWAQLALADPKAKGHLATLVGRIGEKKAEADFYENQFARTRVLSPQDGVAIIDDPVEWIGRPVQTGERIMRVANPHELDIEAWVAVGDAIPLAEDARVMLYLASAPLKALSGRLRYIGHDAVHRPDGTMTYRLRATLDDLEEQRIGLKGTAKIYGDWVPMGYWMLRRPLASLRQFLVL